MKSISFRFDVDTDLCFSVGVPNLIKLAEKRKFNFTFYVNVGRAIDYFSILKPVDKISASNAVKLSAVKKFGALPVMRFILFNKLVAEDKCVIKKLIASNHEVGLHGGSNHAVWHRNASIWDESMLESEVKWGVEKFTSLFGFPPKSFSSPGWNSPKSLPLVLSSFDFQYFADIHGEDTKEKFTENELPNIATQLTGEPGGVGYLEYVSALGLNEGSAVDYFLSNVRRLHKNYDHVIMYDHPGFCGGNGIGFMEGVLDAVVAEGLTVLRVDEYLKAVRSR